jgi:integrase
MAKKPTPVESGIRGVSLLDYGSDYRGLRWQVRVWDRDAGKHKNHRCDEKSAALEWGRDQLGKFITGTDRAGKVTLAEVAPSYLAYLEGVSKPDSMVEARWIMNGAVKFGVGSLKAKNGGAAAQVNKFLAHLAAKTLERRGRPLSQSTTRRYALHFRQLGNWLLEKGDGFAQHPFKALAVPKKQKKLPPAFTLDESMKLVTTALGHDDGLIVAAYLYTGMRQRELSWLRWSQIRWSDNKIRITLPDAVDRAESERLRATAPQRRKTKSAKAVKGDKERLIDLEPELAELLKPHAKLDDSYVWVDTYRRYTNTSWSLLVKRVLAHCGIDKRDRRLHSLRATYACIRLAAGLDVVRLRKQLGHESLSMTDHYASAAEEFVDRCRDWKGHLLLRQLCNSCAKTPPSVASPDQSEGVAASEDDGIDWDNYVIVIPDHSELWREEVLRPTGTDGWDSSRLGPGAARRAGSTPAVRTTSSDKGLDDEECIACPS